MGLGEREDNNEIVQQKEETSISFHMLEGGSRWNETDARRGRKKGEKREQSGSETRLPHESVYIEKVVRQRREKKWRSKDRGLKQAARNRA